MKKPEFVTRRADTPLKERLVAVTIDLLLETRHVKLPTMREIAGAAGVAPGAPYRHFSSQAELLVAVVTALFGRLETFLVTGSIRGAGAGPGGVVRELAHAYVQWGLENPGSYQLLFETTDDEDALARGDRPAFTLLERVGMLLAQHSHSDQPRLDDAARLWTNLHGIVSLRTHKTGMEWPSDVRADVDRLVDQFL